MDFLLKSCPQPEPWDCSFGRRSSIPVFSNLPRTTMKLASQKCEINYALTLSSAKCAPLQQMPIDILSVGAELINCINCMITRGEGADGGRISSKVASPSTRSRILGKRTCLTAIQEIAGARSSATARKTLRPDYTPQTLDIEGKWIGGPAAGSEKNESTATLAH